MKFPSIFKTAKPMSFDIKPRYYDPIREEIEQRTERIKRELQAEGKIQSEEEITDSFRQNYGSSIRGAFAQGGAIKGRTSSVLTSAGMLRMIILILLIGSMIGYIYYGALVLYGILYVAGGGVLLALFLKLKGRSRR
ncbi:hypothetical protein MM214_13400 [Belliella kenyensis]|nr:hypothetical protein [Belliella kenyensis]MCH7402857.1 hypothetical protein [Belliella kenyensis]MDN3602563.1 hypothetical protein [Belliella kenyensis]